MRIINDNELLQTLRELRKNTCFPVVNRGKLWYDMLSKEQLNELRIWYKQWLDVTDTKTIPVEPDWINKKIKNNMEVL